MSQTSPQVFIDALREAVSAVHEKTGLALTAISHDDARQFVSGNWLAPDILYTTGPSSGYHNDPSFSPRNAFLIAATVSHQPDVLHIVLGKDNDGVAYYESIDLRNPSQVSPFTCLAASLNIGDYFSCVAGPVGQAIAIHSLDQRAVRPLTFG